MVCIEVDRAIENLAKSGKMFGNMGMPPANRRESMPVIPRGGAAGGYPDYGRLLHLYYLDSA